MNKKTIKVPRMKSRKEIWPDSKIDRLVDYQPFCTAVEHFLATGHRVDIGVSSWTGDPLGYVSTHVPYSGPGQVVVTVKEGEQHRLFNDLVTDMRALGYKVSAEQWPYGGDLEVSL